MSDFFNAFHSSNTHLCHHAAKAVPQTVGEVERTPVLLSVAAVEIGALGELSSVTVRAEYAADAHERRGDQEGSEQGGPHLSGEGLVERPDVFL